MNPDTAPESLETNRHTILRHLQAKLESDEHVYAMWLEGSDGTGTSDEFSDLDINVDVEDGYEIVALTNIKKFLEDLGKLDSISVITRPNEDLWFQVFHIATTSPYLLIDVNIQRHSRDFSFYRENKAEIPVVLFDKANVIQFKNVDSEEQSQHMQAEMQLYVSRIEQTSRIEKYLKRGKFLEAFAYYQRYVLESVVGLARILHTPLNTSYNLVSISKQLPLDIVKKIEYLYQISSLKDIEDKLPIAIRLFRDLQANYPQ